MREWAFFCMVHQTVFYIYAHKKVGKPFLLQLVVLILILYLSSRPPICLETHTYASVFLSSIWQQDF